MRNLSRVSSLLIAIVAATTTAAFAAEPPAGLSASQRQQLASAKYVYIQSTRKDGSLSKPAEIWFMFHDDAVWVGTTPQAFRAKRIKAGRPRARIAIGKLDNDPFFARGQIVNDTAAETVMLKTYGEKYPDRWPSYEEKFRNGFKDGSRILIKYVPEK